MTIAKCFEQQILYILVWRTKIYTHFSAVNMWRTGFLDSTMVITSVDRMEREHVYDLDYTARYYKLFSNMNFINLIHVVWQRELANILLKHCNF